MKIYIGGDHVGYKYKEELKTYLSEVFLDAEILDKGASNLNEDDDYPDFITPVAESVASDEESFGIILGGSGQGEAMCANRVRGARAIVFYGEELPEGEVDISGRKSIDTFEIVKLGRMHNDANILSIGVRFVSLDEAKFAIELFLKTEFSKEERHTRRINKF
ncbi:MAG: RpiB/LacA/LacB family sugar-phosphate isomerase [Candidatus Paceibacterota bacterium]